MTLHTEKQNLIDWISKLEDPSIIYRIKQLKDNCSQSDKQEGSLKQAELDSIKRGLKDFENGKIHAHQTARDIYEKYL